MSQAQDIPSDDVGPDAQVPSRVQPKTRPLIARIRPHDRTIALALGLMLLGIYLATSGFRIQSIDEVLSFTTARSLLGRGTLDADTIYWAQPEGNHGGSVVTGENGHAYVVKDIGPSLLVLPLMWIADTVKIISPFRTALLLSPILTALTAALLFLLARSRGYGVTPAMIVGLIFGLASLAWPYAESLFTQPLAALGLLLALIGAILAYERNSWRFALLSGIGIGIASHSAIPTLSTLPIYPLYLVPWGSLRDGTWRAKMRGTLWLLVAFAAGLAPFGLLHAALDQAHFGSPFITSYHASQVQDALQLSNLGVAGYGLLLSTPRGLLWYMPIVLLIPFGVWLGWKFRRREIGLAAAQAAVAIIFYSTYTEWWGGNAWGPRLFLPVMPALVWLIAPLIERLSGPSRWWWRALAALPVLASLVMQALATVFNTIVTERRFYDDLIAVRRSPTFLQDYPVLTNPTNLPWRRLVTVINRGRWDTLWMSRGAPDWPLIAAFIVLVVLGVAGLVLALRYRKGRTGWLRGLLYGHIALAVAVTGFALIDYRRLPDDYTPAETPPNTDLDQAIALVNSSTTRDDQIVTLLPYSYLLWLDRTTGAVHDTGFGYEQPLRGLTERRLTQVTGETGRIWLVTEKIDAGNSANGVEKWLSERAFAGVERVFGDYRVVPYTLSNGVPLKAQGRLFAAGIRLDSAGYELVKNPRSEWLNVWLRWDATREIPKSYTVFVHLLNEDGQVAAQHDGLPSAAYAPTQTWKPGTEIEDRHSIAVEITLPAGMYQISIGLYDTLTGERLPLDDGSGNTVVIGTIEIR